MKKRGGGVSITDKMAREAHFHGLMCICAYIVHMTWQKDGKLDNFHFLYKRSGRQNDNNSMNPNQE